MRNSFHTLSKKEHNFKIIQKKINERKTFGLDISGIFDYIIEIKDKLSENIEIIKKFYVLPEDYQKFVPEYHNNYEMNEEEIIERENLRKKINSLTDYEIIYNLLIGANFLDEFIKNIHKLFDDKDGPWGTLKYWRKDNKILKFINKQEFTKVIFDFYMDYYNKYRVFDYDVMELTKGNILSWESDTRLTDIIFTKCIEVSLVNYGYKNMNL